jgi:hypothetical protein
MDRTTGIQRLADFIEAHPDCQFEIDNDAWYINDKDGKEIANSEKADFDFTTDWYSHSNNYGFGLAEALIELLNRRGFNITASAV